MFAPAREKKTYADYAALEEGAPYQLIDGELVITPAPTFLHQLVVWRLGNQLFNHAEQHGLGVVVGSPVDVYFSESETYQPDLVFIAKDRLDIVTEQRMNGAPDLVAEVLSPATSYYDLTKKRRVYEASGVKEYWLVDPSERSVEVLALVEGLYEIIGKAHQQGRAASRLLPGFEVMERLFSF